MELIITQICGEIHNYFEDRLNGASGEFSIVGGTLPLDFVKEGQLARISGSAFNDGVHMYPFYDLQDETFIGAVRAMLVPPELMELAADIQKGMSEGSLPSGASPYTAESFGGYSYTRATDANGAPADWRVLYARRLDKWRKLP